MDNVTVLIETESRNEIELKGQVATQIITNWCLDKLKMNPKKTKALLLLGKINSNSPPKIPVDADVIRHSGVGLQEQ